MQFKSTASLLLMYFLSCSLSAQNQTKITASDAASGDAFGYGVDVSGDFAIVGARFNDEIVGTNAGAAYIYLYNGSTWVQTQKLLPSDGAAGDEFGISVALDDGTTAVVGAHLDDDQGSNSGSAYVFKFNGTAWQQVQKLIPSDGQAGDDFGFSVDVSGNSIIVGSRLEDAGGGNAGAAYIYNFNGTNWLQAQKILASDAATSDYFGFDVSISGSYALIGAPLNDDNGSSAGSAYVFYFNGIGWVQLQKLLASDAAGGDQFGYAVKIDGMQSIIGGPFNDDQGSSSGSAYIFDFTGATWIQGQKLLPSGGQSGDQFGLSVDIDDDLAAIGAPWDDDNGTNSGSAYLFANIGTWVQQAKMLAGDGAAFDTHGESVAISDSLVIAGADSDDDVGTSSGSAYLYSFGPPPNDLCAGALPIGCGQTISSSTAFATGADAPAFCTTALNSAPGVWYTFTGTGESVEISMCNSNYDTKLGLFAGSCGSLTCIAGNDDFCGTNNLQSQVTAPTTLGTQYYIYVTGFQTQAGNFALTLTCFAPINDICVNALPISCGQSISETTANATAIGAPTTCGTDVSTAPGVWYAFAGTGDSVTFSLCNSTYDTKIAVYAGVCNSNTCITGNDDACGTAGLASSVTIPTFQGINYLVYVTGFGSQSGIFQLDVVCGPGNDQCSDAIELVCGATITGNTTGASNTGNPGTCNSFNLGTGPGLWYKFTGTGDFTSISLCGSSFDTQLGLLTGSCGSLSCFFANDDFCGTGNLNSQIDFTSTPGTEYYIYVTGFQSNAGAFTLSISCMPGNDLCSGAVPVICGSSYSGSTANASANDAPAACGVVMNTAPGVWYSFSGNGKLVTASLCNSLFDTKIGVYSGSCGTLTCMAGNDDACGPPGAMLLSEVTWQADTGADYYIYVTGFGTQNGDYILDIFCAQDNNDCANAFQIACGDTTTGSTIGAGNQPGLAICNSFNLSTGPGVWYEFMGMGEIVTVSLDGSDYDTQLGIFTNSCDSLVCVTANDDITASVNLQSADTFTAELGTTYYIYVTGFQSFSGTYQLAVNCATPSCNAAPVASTSNLTANSVTLNWTPVPGTVTYRIQGGQIGKPIVTLNVPGTTTSFQVNNLPNNTAYLWVVRALCNPSGTLQTPLSNIDTFTTLVGCPTPDTLFANNLTTNSVTLNWTTVATAIGYRISGNAIGVSPDVVITLAGGSTSSFNVINLASNTTFAWQVQAVCAAGPSLPTTKDTFSTLVAAKAEVGVDVDLGIVPEVRLYPNPANDFLMIELSGASVDHWKGRIYNSNGRLVYAGEFNQKQVRLELSDDLTNGVYVISVEGLDKPYVEKIIILK